MTNLSAIADRLCHELGMDPSRIGGRSVLLEHVSRFCVRTGLDPEHNAEAWKELIADVVVPETSFFRYPESFGVLSDLASRRKDQHLRVLSLPCSTGEEAWSIAIALREAGCGSFEVLACDASVRAIETAEAGVYRRERIRMESAWRERYFEHIADGRMRVRADLRPHVEFREANILLSPIDGVFDFLFCRNLLIYSGAAHQQQIFARLLQLLRRDGVLFLGPGEATCAPAFGWAGADWPMAFAFVPRPPIEARAKAPIPRKQSSGITPGLDRPRQPSPAAPPPPRESALASARRLADGGSLAEASEILRAHHALDAPSTESLLLQGVIAEAQGNSTLAENCYRQSLYLNPGNLDALMHLSRLLESGGREEAAQRLRLRAQRISSQ